MVNIDDYKYSIKIIWSDEDNSYLFLSAEFPTLSAFGETYDEALHEDKQILSIWIQYFTDKGIPLPTPLKLSHEDVFKKKPVDLF